MVVEVDVVPFHPGERLVHGKAGVDQALIERLGKLVREAMPEQHSEFFQNQRIMYAATLDAQGRPEAHILVGKPGIVTAPDAQTLRLHLPAMLEGGAALGRLQRGDTVGMLGIEFHTRRRNRVNGTVIDIDADGLTLRVDQSYGNCPKYIQKRAISVDPRRQGYGGEAPGVVGARGSLPPQQRQFIAAADTFFIASSSPAAEAVHPRARGCDLSHRGGHTGFVQVARDGSTLRWADYVGNNMFMTLGNIVRHADVGMLFVDYESGASLHVHGTARVLWDERALPGAQRTVEVEVEEWQFRPDGSLPLTSSPVYEWSPANPEA